MSDLKNRYKEILKELENNIQDEKQRNFVISKFQELSIIFMDIIDRLTYITDIRVKDVEEKQKEIESRIASVQKTVDGIENDIYEDDESYEFEITCPYCNHDFVTDINSEINTEVECPECHNVIELDWNMNDEEECGHECSSCGHGCMEDENEQYNSEDEEDEENEESPEDDDM